MGHLSKKQLEASWENRRPLISASMNGLVKWMNVWEGKWKAYKPESKSVMNQKGIFPEGTISSQF